MIDCLEAILVKAGAARRGGVMLSVIACDKRVAFAQESEAMEAIHLSPCGEMDCFAPQQ